MDSQPSQEVTDLLKQWEDEHTSANYDPIPTLTRLSEIIEAEAENFMKKDPDPFDERHPSRMDPNCALGHALKVMFKKDTFMTKLVNDYVRETYYSRQFITGRDVTQLNIAACRLTLDLMPGLEMSIVFQGNESLITRLYMWAENSVEPLQSYATGLLAAAMEVSEFATANREQNAKLVPLMLQRLHTLRNKFQGTSQTNADIIPLNKKSNVNPSPQKRHFARFGKRSDADHITSPLPKKRGRHKDGGTSDAATNLVKPVFVQLQRLEEHHNHNGDIDSIAAAKNYESGDSPSREIVMSPPPRPPPLSFCNIQATDAATDATTPVAHHPTSIAESSNSSWAEMESHVIGSVQIHPLSDSAKQILILKYLSPLGEYQEFLPHVFEHQALELIMGYIDVRKSLDSRLAFEALKYLASLLCHKKFSLELINCNGLQKLLEVPRPSVAATGVSICLYYLAYCEDAVERVCQLPRSVVADLVRYALWLLECSHDSGRCHATMFFGMTFQFLVILEEFDHQDGLRKLYNVISTLPILSEDEVASLTDDETCSAQQIVRHVSVALKRYFDAHLRLKVVQLSRQGNLCPHFTLEASVINIPPYKAAKRTPEQLQEHKEALQKSRWSRWAPVDQLVGLGGVSLLLQIIAFTYEWNFNGRAETVRCALDVISVCCVVPKVQLLLCEKVEMPEDEVTVGVNVILGAAEGEIVADAEVQKAALNVLVNCVCAPARSFSRYPLVGSVKKKSSVKYDDIIQKVWENVRRNNGIMVLLQLMLIKSPITDADSIRGLACRALAGLARCPTVTQIISKLPMFTTGQIQSLMRDPILQEKRQEHVMFQKYALELMERVSGKSKHMGTDIETSLANIHRANVVAQTRIRYNHDELLVLIYRHLHQRGLRGAATALKEEAQLAAPEEPEPPHPHHHPQLYDEYPCRPRALGRSLISAMNACTPPMHSSSGHLQLAMVNGDIGMNTLAVPSPNVIKLRRIQQQPSLLALTSPMSTTSAISAVGASVCGTGIHSLTPRSLQKQTSRSGAVGAPPPAAIVAAARRAAARRVTLDSIVTEYLTNQHALCRNPIATCPQFNLFEPHKCSEWFDEHFLTLGGAWPHTDLVPGNQHSGVASRVVAREYDSCSFARGHHVPPLLHSRFANVRTLRTTDVDCYFTTCIFHPTQHSILAATSSGDIKIFNLSTVQDDISHTLHDTYIYHMQASKDGRFLLASTNTTWRPLSSVWNLKDYSILYQLDDEEYVEFSKVNEDRVIGTKAEIASIYDIHTEQQIMQLKPTISNQYTKNRATFNPTDDLVLSDGVLWDVNAGKEIHKLDKLNQSLSGVFHPNGLEIISNTEVWDLRTFHLLKTVPSLDKAEVLFPPTCSCIYSVRMEQDNEEKTQFDTSFKTLDPYHYSNISTIDVKRYIYALSVNRFDTQIALVENLGEFDSVQESVIKIYDVGRRRDLEDEAEEEEDDDIGAGSENDDVSDSGSENDDLASELFRNAMEGGALNGFLEQLDDNDVEVNASDGNQDDDASFDAQGDRSNGSASDSDSDNGNGPGGRYNRRLGGRNARTTPRRAAGRRAPTPAATRRSRRRRRAATVNDSDEADVALAVNIADELVELQREARENTDASISDVSMDPNNS